MLAATYNHSTEFMADKEDLYLQPETHGCDTWRRIRNTHDPPPQVVIPMVYIITPFKSNYVPSAYFTLIQKYTGGSSV